MKKEVAEGIETATICRAELESCDFIKTILMLIVVIYHSILFWTGSWLDEEPIFSSTSLAGIARWMNTFHIYGFTLVSGYIFYHVKYRLGKYRDYKGFLLNKAKRLLVPYLFAAVVWVIPFQRYFMDSGILRIVEKYVLGTSPSQLWFLLMLFGVFAIMWPMSEFMSRHTIGGAFVVSILFIIGYVGQSVLPNIFQIWTASKYCLYFWLGMKLCQYSEHPSVDILRKIPIWVWCVTDIALFIGTDLIPKGNLVLKLIVAGMNAFLNIYGAVMAFRVLCAVYKKVPWKDRKHFSRWSKYSFPIYLFHQQLIYCTIYLLNGRINPYLNAVLNFSIAFGGSVLISWLLRKFRITRLLLGEKG